MHWSKKLIGILLLIIVVSFFFLQNKFKSEVINAIDTKLPSNIKLEYSQVNTSILTGSIELDSLSAQLFSSERDLISTFNTNKFKISGFSLWQFLLNKNIAIEAIIFENPNLQYYQKQYKKQQSKDTTINNNQFDKNITIDEISLINGSLKVYENNDTILLTSIDSVNFTLNKLNTNTNKLKEKIPFNYKSFQLNAKHFFTNLSSYETLEIETLTIEDDKLNLKKSDINPKYTKEELSSKITVERDYFDLHIPEITINKLDFGFKNNTFFVTADSSKITKPNLVVYRDKRVTDDLSIKKMYSKMLRDLDFNLTFSEIKVNNGYVSYAERVEDTNKAGKIFFNAIDANLSNLSNRYAEGNKTVIAVASKFMGKSPMRLDISFDVNNTQDHFLVSGQFKNFDTKIANTFFKSNLNAKAEGQIEQIYFTLNGNNFDSEGDLKMKYEDFKFEILNKKNNVNKLLTAIGNIFVNDGSKTDKDGYRHGEIKVERNNTKSFFNYLWINVQDGLISTLTGNGKKE